MWMKNLPHCTFSDFQGKKGGVNGASCFKHPSQIKNEFSDIPNYQLASKAFDAQHLDKFITKINESEMNSFNQFQLQQTTAEDDEVLHDAAVEEFNLTEEVVGNGKEHPKLKSALATHQN